MKLSNWLELVGIVSIVVSLLFVGYEVRQNTKLASAQALAEINATYSEMFDFPVQDPELAALVLKARTDDPNETGLSDVEEFRYTMFLQKAWNAYEVAYIYYRNGLLDETDFESWHTGMCSDYSEPFDRIRIDELILLPGLFEFVRESCCGQRSC